MTRPPAFVAVARLSQFPRLRHHIAFASLPFPNQQVPLVSHLNRTDRAMPVQIDSFHYFDTLMTIQVEDTLFRVPRREFEEESEVFASMFTLPPGSEEGLDDEHPLRLQGVTATEFQCFLRGAVPRRVLSREPLDDKELEKAIYLVTMWGFHGLREALICDLGNLGLRPARYLQLARTYDRNWYKDQLQLLALRPESLSEEEVTRLGSELTAIVSKLRDERFNAIPSLDFDVSERA